MVMDREYLKNLALKLHETLEPVRAVNYEQALALGAAQAHAVTLLILLGGTVPNRPEPSEAAE